MDITLLREALLVLALIAFCGIVGWAYAPSRRARFERDAFSVFDDEDCDRAALSPVARGRKGA